MSNEPKRVMSIGEFAKRVGASPLTIRRQIYKGLIKPLRTPSGRYKFTEKHVQEYLGEKNKREQSIVIYARVSTAKQKKYLDSQIEKCELYAASKGYSVSKVYKDIGSAFNFKRKGLNELLNDVINGEVDTVIVYSKDRLSRIAFELFQTVFEKFGTNIEIVVQDETPADEEKLKEAVEELVQFVHYVTSKIYGSRSKKTKKIVECVKNG